MNRVKYYLLSILVLVLFVLGYSFLSYEIYDELNIDGIIKCNEKKCSLMFSSNSVSNYKKIVIENKNYDIYDIEIGDLYINDFNMQVQDVEVIFKYDKSFNNKMDSFSLLYDLESIWIKMFNIIYRKE